MSVSIGNVWYFAFILLFIGSTVGLYYLLRNKQKPVKIAVLYSFLVLNVLIHFLFTPFVINKGGSYLELIILRNMCAVTVFLYPFIFWTKNRFLKNGIIVTSIFSGVLSMLVPVEAIDNSASEIIDTLRFYFQHIIIGTVSISMLSLGLWKMEMRDIWLVPAYIMCCFAFICFIEACYFYLNIGPWQEYGLDRFNNTLQWTQVGPQADMGWIFNWITPPFLRKIPVLHAGIGLHFYVYTMSFAVLFFINGIKHKQWRLVLRKK